MDALISLYATLAQIMATFAAIFGGVVIVLAAEQERELRRIRRSLDANRDERAAIDREWEKEAEAMNALRLDMPSSHLESFASLLHGEIDEAAYRRVILQLHEDALAKQSDALERQVQRRDRLVQLVAQLHVESAALEEMRHGASRFAVASLAVIGIVYGGVLWPIELIADEAGPLSDEANEAIKRFRLVLFATVVAIMVAGFSFGPWRRPRRGRTSSGPMRFSSLRLLFRRR